jgi:hypothetical protein
MMNSQLAEVREKLRGNSRRAAGILAKVGEDRFLARPGEDSWSAAECLGHLTLSTEMFMPRWDQALEDARTRKLFGRGPFEKDLVGVAFVWALEPTTRVRAKAPAFLHPSRGSNTLPDFLASQEKLIAHVEAWNGLAVDRIKVASPVASIVRYSVWSSFEVTDTHQRRHLLQAERAAGLKD